MAFIFGYSNLVASNGSVTAHEVNMTADWIVVDDGSGNTLRIPMTTNINIDKNQSQKSTEPNRRDVAGTGAPSTWQSQWISIWAIYNPVTNTIAGLFSLSSTAPTLPSGYTHKAYVGAVYSAITTGNFDTFSQVDNKVVRPYIQISGITSTTYGTNTLPASAVPPTAKAMSGFLSMSATAEGDIFLSPTTDGVGEQRMHCLIATPPTVPAWQNNYRIPLITPQTAYSKINPTGNTGAYFVTEWEY